MDFDSSMSKIQALSGSTGEELIALKDKAVELGASTAWSASQVSEAMQYMALAGWDANDMLEGTAGILSATSATGEDLAAVCDIVTDGLSASNGYSIMQNGGEFNDVGQYYLHIFPRYEGDGFGWKYANDSKYVNAEIAKRIRDRIS